MKKSLIILVLTSMTLLAGAQTTYFWIGGTGATSNLSFTSTSSSSPKWNTALDGSGTNRTVNDPTDILIIDGTNVGGATPTTGLVTATCGSTAVSQLIIRNGGSLTLVRPSTGTGTITINGDATAADDFLVNAGCSFKLTVADSVAATSGNNLLLNTNATGRVFGSMALSLGASRTTASNPAVGGSLFFESGSTCRVNTLITYYPFGSNSGVPNAVVFKNGSTLIYEGGNSMFTSTSSYNPLDLQSGSTLRFEASIPNTLVTSSNIFSARRLSNVTVGNNQTVTGDFFYNIDNLTIESGSTFYIKGSGASPVSGNIINNGTFGSATGFTSSNLLMKGIAPQTISGTGTFLPLGALSVGAGSDVTLNANLSVNGTTNSLINGKMNFSTYSISGTGSLQTKAALTITTAVTTGVVGGYTISLDPAAYSSIINTAGVYNGLYVTGTGIPANSFIIGTSSSSSTITISNPLTATPSSATISGNFPVLRTANINGIDGSIGSIGTQSISSSTDFIFDAATAQPFSTISVGTMRNVTFNASATTNRTAVVDSILTINTGVLSIRPTDTIRIKNGKDIGGAPFNTTKYIATISNATTTGTLRIDLVGSEKLFPVGSAAHYLPITFSPISSSNLTANVYEGITTDGMIGGTPLSGTDLLSVVNAVWKVGRVSGSGDLGINIKWDAALEGSLFATQANSRIGMIKNSGTAWSVPFGIGDNFINSVDATSTTVGYFGVGSQPLMTPFVFNPIAPRIYGDADFNSAVSSLNITQPIVYSSSDPSVATISSTGIIHIVGVGTTNITVTQASDGTYVDANETQPLLINKAPLTIKADDLAKFQGDVNPTLTATYTGFVNGETESVLLTLPTLVTTATQASPIGTYPITASGASAQNYEISYLDGVLSIVERQTQVITFNSLPAVTYGQGDFIPLVTSTNSTIPIILTSSDNNVATIVNGNTIHIVGAGTTIITASQAGSPNYFPAVDVANPLEVLKAPLQIAVADTVKLEGAANPQFRFIYSGFVLGETASDLVSQPVVNTSATTSSAPGIFTVSPADAASANYSFTYVDGRLTIYPSDSLAQTLSAYNNNSGQVVVRIFSPESDLGSVIIYDQQGRFLARKDIFVAKGFNSTQIDVLRMASANYIVTFRGKKNIISKIVPIIK